MFFRIGGITIKVESDIPLTEESFDPKFHPFRVSETDDDVVIVRHHHLDHMPKIEDWGQEIYHKVPWAIHRTKEGYIYRALSAGRDTDESVENSRRIVLFDEDHTRGEFYHDEPYLENVKEHGFRSLTLLSSDQILLARLLASRRGVIFHASGVILDGKGFLFVGHSTAGKSTMVKMLRDHAEILCDDRIIVREETEGLRIYGTWSHGEVDLVSPSDAPLTALFVLQKAQETRTTPIPDRKMSKELWRYTIKALVTKDWVQNTWDVLETIPKRVPCYRLSFDLSGQVVGFLKDWEE